MTNLIILVGRTRGRLTPARIWGRPMGCRLLDFQCGRNQWGVMPMYWDRPIPADSNVALMGTLIPVGWDRPGVLVRTMSIIGAIEEHGVVPDRAPVSEHNVRGHYRRLRNGDKIWIEGFRRGGKRRALCAS